MRRGVYKRPDKATTLPITQRDRRWGSEVHWALAAPVEVSRDTECHVTPPDVANRMVEYLGPVGDFLTLEPQAGTGNLVEALRHAGHSYNQVVAIERNWTLCDALERRFSSGYPCELIQQCFLSYANEAAMRVKFPRIISNPPFRHVKRHMEAALSLLGRGGHHQATLVALVPVTYKHSEAHELEILDTDTFSTAKVRTKIIYIQR